jgi:putative tryptophan/tyrosine transport system substrate-binding protein
MMMRRREFIAGLGGAAASTIVWSVASRAQPQQMRRVALLLNLSEADPEAQAIVQEFRQGMTGLGWQEGRNVRIEHRFAGGDSARYAI